MAAACGWSLRQRSTVAPSKCQLHIRRSRSFDSIPDAGSNSAKAPRVGSIHVSSPWQKSGRRKRLPHLALQFVEQPWWRRRFRLRAPNSLSSATGPPGQQWRRAEVRQETSAPAGGVGGTWTLPPVWRSNSRQFEQVTRPSAHGSKWPIECQFACDVRTRISIGIHR